MAELVCPIAVVGEEQSLTAFFKLIASPSDTDMLLDLKRHYSVEGRQVAASFRFHSFSGGTTRSRHFSERPRRGGSF